MKPEDLSTQTNFTSSKGRFRIFSLYLNYFSTVNILLTFVVLGFLFRFHLIFVYEINWDEFLHLSLVHNYSRGEMNQALQTAFIHLFHWVKSINGNEVDQVIAARVVIYVLGSATVSFLFLISRRFMPVHAALFAVLSYLSFSFVLRQGNSFRTDPIATFFLMATLWLIVCRPMQLRYALAAGVLTGLAGMITIKSIFYVPTIAIILLVQLFTDNNRRNVFFYGLTTGVSALAGFLAIYTLHSLTLVDLASTGAFLESVTSWTLGERNFSNAIATFRLAVLQNPVFWVIASVGIAACLRGLIRATSQDAACWATLLSFGVPLGSLLVYTQTFPYYYPFMLAPVAVLCGAGVTIVPGNSGSKVTVIAGMMLGVLLISHYILALRQDTATQRLTLEVIHQAFPEPTPYIDRNSMVSSYPKRGFFMSVWGMSNYYRVGVPVMRSVIERDQPRFLIANRRMLELDDLGPDEFGPSHFGLFKEDIATLKANYIRHWGAIYVAGKTFDSSIAGPAQNFEILIEGSYTVESAEPVIFDGKEVQPGDVINLASGTHRLRMREASPDVTLRWGDHLYRPLEITPGGPLFTGF
jgi:hypothetical protein